MIDYGTLKLIWWFFILALFILFFIFGGRDFGVCTLLPWVAKTNEERRLLINSIGTTWEGNQVWFVTAGGAIFAAWPIVYATAFSGLYYALFAVLLSLILRPPGIDFRSKLPHSKWHSFWDGALFISGFVPALIFGVGLGNLVLGLPFHFDENLQSHYTGSFWQLLNPLSIFFGLSAVTILAMHGGLFLQAKLDETFTACLQKTVVLCAVLFGLFFVLLGVWVSYGLEGYQIESLGIVNGSLNPPAKNVLHHGSWLLNYQHYPLLWLLPVFTLINLVVAVGCSLTRHPLWGVVMSSLTITTALGTVSAALFPFILPSLTHPNHSLTLWDATSSHRTLQYMFVVTVIFLPIVLSYTFWAFRVFRGKLVAHETLAKSEAY